jgi:hypothetical protein
MRRWSRTGSAGVGVRRGCGEGAFVGVGDGIVGVAAGGGDEGGVEEAREVAFEEGFGGGNGCADLSFSLVVDAGRGRKEGAVLRSQRTAQCSWSPIHSKCSTSRPDPRCRCRCSRFGLRRRRRLVGRRRRGGPR